MKNVHVYLIPLYGIPIIYDEWDYLWLPCYKMKDSHEIMVMVFVRSFKNNERPKQ